MHEKSPVVIPVQQEVSDALGSALQRELKPLNSFQRVLNGVNSLRGKRQIEQTTHSAAPFSDSAFTADKILSTRLTFKIAPAAYQPGAMCDALKKKYGTLERDDQISTTPEPVENGKLVSGRQSSSRKRNRSDELSKPLSPTTSPNKSQILNQVHPCKPTDIVDKSYEHEKSAEARAETNDEIGQKSGSPSAPNNCVTPPPGKSALDAFSTPPPPMPNSRLRSPSKTTPSVCSVESPEKAQSPSVAAPSKSPVIRLGGGSDGSRQQINKERARSNSGNTPTTSASPNKSVGLPSPRVDFFPAGRLIGRWPEQKIPRAGLQNSYSNCYANSAVQCLFNCAHLVNFLLKYHERNGPCFQNCSLCWMNGLANAFCRPSQRLYSTKMINFIRDQPSLRLYHHEDAQEFILLLLERMHLDYIKYFRAQNQRNHNNNFQIPKHIDVFTEYTTPINRIFSGFYCQRIQCMQCKTIHDPTYQPFRDIQLDVGNDGFDIKAGLKRFSCIEEMTDANNLYDCEICKKKCRAKKVLRIFRAPPVLMLQFKRFRRNRFILASKIGAAANVPLELDLRPYMSVDVVKEGNNGTSFLYQLSGAVIHHGSSLAGGHYTAVCCGGNDIQSWYEYDDTYVSPIRTMAHLRNILSHAYVVFYRRVGAEVREDSVPATTKNASQPVQKQESLKRSCSLVGSKNASPPLSMAPKEHNSVMASLMDAYGGGSDDDDNPPNTTKVPNGDDRPSTSAAAVSSVRRPITYDRNIQTNNGAAAQAQPRLPAVTPPRDAADASLILSTISSATKVEARQPVSRSVSASKFYGGSNGSRDNSRSPNKQLAGAGSVIIASNDNSTVRYNKQVKEDPFNNYNEQGQQQQHSGATTDNQNAGTTASLPAVSPSRRLNSNYTSHAAASSSYGRPSGPPSFVPRQVHNGSARPPAGMARRRGNHYYHPYNNNLKGFVIDNHRKLT